MTTKALTPFQGMATDITVTFDDVVSAYVAKYETNLFSRKEELNADLKINTADLEALEQEVLNTVSGAEFEVKNIQPFDLMAEVSDTSVNWSVKKVQFDIRIRRRSDSDSSGYYSNRINITREKSIPKPLLTQYNKLQTLRTQLTTELAKILDKIKGVARKERQVRGQIAMRKLEDQGYGNLMEDEELVALVQIDG